MLDAFEDGFHLIHFDFPVIGLHCLENVLQADGQITRIVDGVDEREGDGLIQLAEPRELHLPQQVILQRFGRFALVDGFIIATGQPAGLMGPGGVELIPGGVHRQLIRHVFLIQRLAGVELAIVGGLVALLGWRFGPLLIRQRLQTFTLFLFEQRIGIQRLLDLLLKFQRRELKQADGLLKLWRHGQ